MSVFKRRPYSDYSGSFPYCRHTVTPTPQQRHRPVLSPPMCHNGGGSRVCRRFLWRKLHTTVALPVLAAVHFGDNLAQFANLYFNTIAPLFSGGTSNVPSI